MASLFTQIIQREIPAAIVWENDQYIAFMDAFPKNPGHLLVCPKMEVDSLFDLPADIYAGLWEVVRMLADPLQESFDSERIIVLVEGFLVPHAHVHMIPAQAAFPLDAPRDFVELALLEQSAEKVRERLRDEDNEMG